jgi:hypothetical protein
MLKREVVLKREENAEEGRECLGGEARLKGLKGKRVLKS